MNRRSPSPTQAAGTSSRRAFDASALARAVEVQAREDIANPPTSLASMMGAIRLLAPLIHSRRDAGWTDPQLVEFLRTMGVDITPETLRVYRQRLRKEASQADSLPTPTVQTKSQPVTAPPIDQTRDKPVPTSPPAPDESDDARPSTFSPTLDLDDQV
jgi:hypothetical protein